MNDEELFSKEFADIEPLDSSDKVQLTPPKKDSIPLDNRRIAAAYSASVDDNYLIDDDIDLLNPHDWLEYKKTGVQEGVYRKLRLGKYPVEASLDLHRLNIKQARQQVWAFINDCIQQNHRTVLITHGKGEHSKTPAKMKSYTAYWLRQLSPVMAFHSALPQHGSYGAVYVLLQKSEKQKQKTREQFKGK